MSHESASDAHHSHGHGHEAGHGSFKGYMTGFVLSVILTAIPFWLVMAGVLDSKLLTAVLVMGIGVVQIVVHMVYFLHMNPRSEGGWTMMALIFTLVIVGIAAHKRRDAQTRNAHLLQCELVVAGDAGVDAQGLGATVGPGQLELQGRALARHADCNG